MGLTLREIIELRPVEEAASQNSGIACGRSQKAWLTLTESAQTGKMIPTQRRAIPQLTVLELKSVDFVLAPVEHEQWRIIGQ